MTPTMRALLGAVSAAALAGCATGGGGSTSPAAGASKHPDSDGATPQSGPSATALGGIVQDVSMDAVQVVFGDGTMTLIVDEQSRAFDTSGTTTETLADGILAQSVVQAEGWTAQEIAFAFGGRPGQTRLVLFDTPTGLMGAVSTRKDGSVRLEPPKTGAATFDTSLAGTFRYIGLLNDADRELAVGRGTVKADFGSAAVTAEFPDIDFVVDGVHLETTRLGHDFRLFMSGRIEGDQFSLSGSTLGREDPNAVGDPYSMAGDGLGIFLGSSGGEPTGVAGAIAMQSEKQEIFGDMTVGFEGACDCLLPTPDIPATGRAAFDTGLSGVLMYDSLADPATDELMTGRGVVTVDFGGGGVSGEFTDVDFLRDGLISETTLLGNDFGLAFSGSVTGDQLDLEARSTRNEGPGDFGLVGFGSGVVSAAPGRLEVGASGGLISEFGDPEVFGTFALEGVAPTP